MSERTPVTTAEQLDALDDDEIMEGYWDGRAGEPEPGNNRSLSYWHGWRNGNTDRPGGPNPDAAQIGLVRDHAHQGAVPFKGRRP